jgi:hypothetical protein
MPYKELSSNESNPIIFKDKYIKIMIFTEGTILGPKNIFGHFNCASYIPIGSCVSKIRSWEEQGAEIVYSTSRSKEKQVNEIAGILKKYNFPGTKLYYRADKQQYKDIIELVVPNILIEDDWRSIGGLSQIGITYVKPNIKSGIKSIVVKEFKGIDDLPTMLFELII